MILARTGMPSVSQPVTRENKAVSYNVPSDFPLGAFAVTVKMGNIDYPACETLTVLPAPAWEVKLNPFLPPGTSEVEKYDALADKGSSGKDIQKVTHHVVNLTLLGSGFDTGRPKDNEIYIDGQKQQVTWTEDNARQSSTSSNDQKHDLQTSFCDEAKKDTIFGAVVSGDRIDLCHVPVQFPNADVLPTTAALSVRVVQGNTKALTSGLQTFRVYSFPYSTKVVGLFSIMFAVILTTVVLLLIYTLLRKQPKETRRGMLATLFLDGETDTYSLSKFQFYCWTLAAMFGYCYLVLSRLIVQGVNWPDIPEGLPAIIGIGAITAVGAQVVTNVRGPKGSGAERPSFGDLVTSGGVAAAERVQFFLWTVIGVGAFVVSVLKHAPDLIQSLDPVPTGLLAMMGLSSAGYLGGKLARKPGPVLNAIAIDPSQSDEVLLNAGKPPSKIPDLSQAAAEAKNVLLKIPATATGQTKAAADALNAGVAAATQVNTIEGAQKAVTKIGEQQRIAEAAAIAAAAEFATPGAPSSAANAAHVTQQAAAALQDLSAAVTSAVALSVGPSVPGSAVPTPLTRVIELRGQNLSSEALFEIGGKELPFRMLAEKDGKRLPEVVTREQDNPTLARILRLSIDRSRLQASDLDTYNEWFGTIASAEIPRTFTLINPDGQKAELSFTVPPSAAMSPAKTSQPRAADPTKDQK